MSSEGVVHGFDIQNDGLGTDFNTKNGLYRINNKPTNHDTENTYVKETSKVRTTITSFQTTLELPAKDYPAGNYKLEWSFLWRFGTSSNKVEFRIIVINNTDAITTELDWKPRMAPNNSTNGNDRINCSGFDRIDLLDKNYTIKLQQRLVTSGGGVETYTRIMEINRMS